MSGKECTEAAAAGGKEGAEAREGRHRGVAAGAHR